MWVNNCTSKSLCTHFSLTGANFFAIASFSQFLSPTGSQSVTHTGPPDLQKYIITHKVVNKICIYFVLPRYSCKWFTQTVLHIFLQMFVFLFGDMMWHHYWSNWGRKTKQMKMKIVRRLTKVLRIFLTLPLHDVFFFTHSCSIMWQGIYMCYINLVINEAFLLRYHSRDDTIHF